ncbi:hypothetical protein [Emticicia agri]|uniref:Outer membrane protein beta-barrel domain-containing protein n=1 Tax=Emticicia agri TaxID=2492393 RepID=A0A4Q5M3R4_9BACT|nr:hypothetical protein [Emticicia agri]RYU96942.1 hypothetical protein EWM59_03265 [Emticicia agri]
MKKLIIIISFVCVSVFTNAQILKPQSVSIAYIGEAITHPGMKIGLNYSFFKWDRQKNNKGAEKIIDYSIDFKPCIGFYYHKSYQTGIFALPELSFTWKKQGGSFTAIGVGVGYMRTIIPAVYELDNDTNIRKIKAGNNYLVSNYYIAWGKDLSKKHKIPLEIFIKPHLMVAKMKEQKGIGYFILELGLNYKLR